MDERSDREPRSERRDLGAPSSGAGAPRDMWQQRLAVGLEYPVVFTRGVFERENSTLGWAVGLRESDRRHRILAVVDAGVDRAWPTLQRDIAAYTRARADRMQLVDPPRVITGGEASKNQSGLVDTLQAWFHRVKMDRHAFVLIIGGGAVLDVVGYAAATTHRGLRVIRIPTTVLAQNDAGIGVKNGINAFGVKNFLGTFAAPFAVLNDTDFIATLDSRDRIAGIAEAIKVALIRDPVFFGWLEEHAPALARGDRETTARMIRRCAELHLEHIRTSGDPFETGSARPLDFGHWAAHKLETLSGHALRHGEAVAIGLAIDTHYSAVTGLLSTRDADRVCRVLEAVGLPLWHDVLAERDAADRSIVRGLDEFREHLGGELTITLLEGIGRGLEVNDIDENLMRAAIARLRR